MEERAALGLRLPPRRSQAETPAPATPAGAGVPPRWRGRRARAAEPRNNIPIVDVHHRVVGWTSAPPVVENGGLRHRGAERLLGGRIFCTQVALLRPADIERAGGPASSSGPWRCLALCRIEHARGFAQTGSDPPGALRDGNGPPSQVIAACSATLRPRRSCCGVSVPGRYPSCPLHETVAPFRPRCGRRKRLSRTRPSPRGRSRRGPRERRDRARPSRDSPRSPHSGR